MSIITPPLWFFRGLSLHERLPNSTLETLRQRGRMERWGHRAVIDHDPASMALYVLLDGNVYVRELDRAGRVKLKPGDVFGALAAPPDFYEEDALVASSPDSDLLLAHDDTTLVSLDRGVFDEVAARHLGTTSASMRSLRGSTAVDVPVNPLLYTSPVKRFAKALLHLAETQGVIDGDSAAIDVPMRSRAFASLLGLDTERLTRALQHLEVRGAIGVEGRRLIIPSLERLRVMAR